MEYIQQEPKGKGLIIGFVLTVIWLLILSSIFPEGTKSGLAIFLFLIGFVIICFGVNHYFNSKDDESRRKVVERISKVMKEREEYPYGHIRELKGNITYELCVKKRKKNYLQDPANVKLKLVFPSKQEVIISPLPELKQAFKKSRDVSLVRYEFENELNGVKYLYIFAVGDKFFDLPEEMANDINLKQGIKMQKSTDSHIIGLIK